ncbi:OLC1v1030856C1 [Oldenlandia corymbosa var. corymbosa]|uniref:OLC1v1030856C1 n=1 Tax=Oldenlandia corymbosa var. corymbosa TaxID=529605 RepID=A0AAV1CH01_OLDCO|nr:OLC1v1030856C1 [Oldenlandia corymbosa var. corymbosa]
MMAISHTILTVDSWGIVFGSDVGLVMKIFVGNNSGLVVKEREDFDDGEAALVVALISGGAVEVVGDGFATTRGAVIGGLWMVVTGLVGAAAVMLVIVGVGCGVVGATVMEGVGVTERGRGDRASTRWIAGVEWLNIMGALENCAKAFGYRSSTNEYTFMALCFPPTHGYYNGCTFSFEPCSRIDQVHWKAVDKVCPFRVDDKIWMDRYVYWPIDKPRSGIGPESTELLVSFDTETENFQVIHAPPTPMFVTVTCFPRVKILDDRGTMCVTEENYIYMRDMKFEMWASESSEDNSESWK